MFYQESYKCTMYNKFPEYVECFDFFIGSLTGDVSTKITISLAMQRTGLQYEVVKQLLLYYEDAGILQKMYAITCPNENCTQILKIVSEEDLLDGIEAVKKMMECFDCEQEINEISKDNIFVLYKRALLYTSSQSEVNETLKQHGVIEEMAAVPDNFFCDADSIDVIEIFEQLFHLEESAKQDYILKLKNLTEKDVYDSTVEKGNVLENICMELFNEVVNFEVSRSYRTSTNQLDITVKSVIKFSIPSILDELSPYFIGECKNERRTSGNTYFHKLYSIIEGTDAKVGILFSINPCAKTCFKIARDKYLSSNKRYKLINITRKDMLRVVEGNLNIYKLLKEKIDALTLESQTGLKENSIETYV